jgi:cobalt-zinc-cadmium efflux system outer membrane protein
MQPEPATPDLITPGGTTGGGGTPSPGQPASTTPAPPDNVNQTAPTAGPSVPPPTGTRGEGGANAPPGGPTAAAPPLPFILTGYLSVNQALNEALLRSPRAGAVRALLKIQTALYAAATMMPDPQVMRDASEVSEQVVRLGAQSSWEPPWKLAFRLLSARRQVREQKLELLNTLWGFRNDVRRAYQEVVIAQETYDALSALADLANRLLNVSQKLYKAGSVAGLDVLKAQLAASQAEVDRDQGEARVALAKQQLNLIMGRGPDSTLSIGRLPVIRVRAERTGLLPDLNKTVPPVNEFMEMALSNRLELRILAAQISVAEAQLQNAWGNIIPNPVLVTGYSANGNAPSGPKIKATFFTMNYEVPMFSYSQADIPRLKATIRQFHAQILAQRNQIASDVTTAYNHLLIARKRIAAYQDHILADSERVARLARRSYEVGQSDITSTLAAQQANVQVKQNYLDAVSNYQQAFTDLEQAVGVPLI